MFKILLLWVLTAGTLIMTQSTGNSMPCFNPGDVCDVWNTAINNCGGPGSQPTPCLCGAFNMYAPNVLLL